MREKNAMTFPAAATACRLGRHACRRVGLVAFRRLTAPRPRGAPILLAALLGIWCAAVESPAAPDDSPASLDAEREAVTGEIEQLGDEMRSDVDRRLGASEKDHEEKAESKDMTDPANWWKTDLALWTAVVFVVLLLGLWRFAWGPIAQGLDRREHGIADQIAQAEKANADARQLLAEYEKRMADAQDEVREIIENGRREADKQSQQIVARAQGEANQEKQRALREIDAATAGALKELAARSADLAVDLAGRIVAEQLKPSDHQRLIQQAVDDFSTPN